MRRHSPRILVARSTASSRLWSGAMVLVLVLGFADRAAADGIAPFGVAEDRYGFEAPCNKGEVLTGIFLSSDGYEIQAIGPQCVIASNPRLKNQAVPERWYGANPESGESERAACPDIAPVLLSIRVQTLTNVDSEIQNFRLSKVETFCGVDGSHPSLEQIGGRYATPNVPGWQLGGGTQFCPAGQVAVGIRGRFQDSGEGLYELGLICGDPRLGSRGMLPLSVGNQRIDTSAAAHRAVLNQPSSNVRISPVSRPINGGVARFATPATSAPAGSSAPPAQPPVAQPAAELGHKFMPPTFADRAQRKTMREGMRVRACEPARCFARFRGSPAPFS